MVTESDGSGEGPGLTSFPDGADSGFMNPINALTPKNLRRAADIQEKVLKLQDELSKLLGAVAREESAPAAPKKRKMSAAGRAAIAAAARARWAKLRASTPSTSAVKKPRTHMSTAAKARLSALAKARWKKVKAAGKARL
jgi:hypothetical protein